MKVRFLLGVLGSALVPFAVHGATQTTVPMQGGMAMPMVSYHSNDGMIHVMMPMEVPQLKPLLASNPGDSFDPADPWFSALDPSAQGASFSRRYGFVIDSMNGSDPLPAGFEIDNPNLMSAGSTSELSWLDALNEVAHSEFRQDRFITAVDWSSDQPFKLAYVVRAVSPGTFHHPAASVEDMYRPDFRARSETGAVTITK